MNNTTIKILIAAALMLPITSVASSRDEILKTCKDSLSKKYDIAVKMSNIEETGKYKYTANAVFVMRGKVLDLPVKNYYCEYYPEEGQVYWGYSPKQVSFDNAEKEKREAGREAERKAKAEEKRKKEEERKATRERVNAEYKAKKRRESKYKPEAIACYEKHKRAKYGNSTFRDFSINNNKVIISITPAWGGYPVELTCQLKKTN